MLDKDAALPGAGFRSRKTGPPQTADEQIGFNGRVAAWLTLHLSSMWVVYFTVVFVAAWILLAIVGPLHRADPYPFPFLLFLGNVVQLLLVFVILVGQQVLGRAAEKRSLETYLDAEEILKEVTELHDHLQEQDKILNRGISLVESVPHPWLEGRKAVRADRAAAQVVGFNGKIAAFLTQKVGSMWAFYIAVIGQFGWMALAQFGIIKFDPYPFAFLLFISSLLQLILMFVIMVGQDVLGKTGDTRAHQTYLDVEAVLHEVERLEHHLTAQDKVITRICGYIAEHAADDHPARGIEAPSRHRSVAEID